MNVAGIDVSSQTLHLTVRKRNKKTNEGVFDNNAEGHQKLIVFLKKHRVENVCLEATGIYHLDLALALHKAKKIQVMVVNPKAAKHFSEALMSRTKTDLTDKDMLAEFAERMAFTPWCPPEDEIIAVRACSRRLAALTQQKAAAKNQLHALSATDSTPEFIIEDAQLSIEQIEKQIHTLKTKTLELIKQHELIYQTLRLLVSIKGIAETSAIQLIGELLVLPKDMSAKQWVAFAGLDVRHNQSGTSLNKKSRISKVGNRYVRHALYMPALSATRYEPNVKAYYLHLQNNRGLTKRQALCAVMRKLLHAIHGMLKTQSTFDGTRFYTSSEPVSC